MNDWCIRIKNIIWYQTCLYQNWHLVYRSWHVPILTFNVPKLVVPKKRTKSVCTKLVMYRKWPTKKTYQKCMYQTCHVPKVTYLNLCLGISLLFVSPPLVKTRQLLTFPDNSGSISYWQYSHIVKLVAHVAHSCVECIVAYLRASTTVVAQAPVCAFHHQRTSGSSISHSFWSGR